MSLSQRTTSSHYNGVIRMESNQLNDRVYIPDPSHFSVAESTKNTSNQAELQIPNNLSQTDQKLRWFLTYTTSALLASSIIGSLIIFLITRNQAVLAIALIPASFFKQIMKNVFPTHKIPLSSLMFEPTVRHFLSPHRARNQDKESTDK